MSPEFRAALETALAERPRPTPASDFHTSLAAALAAPRSADDDVIDLRFRALLADALARRNERVVDLRELPEGDAVVRSLDPRADVPLT